MGNSEMIDSSNRLAPFSASRSFPRRGRFSICGLRPLYRQPSLDREGVDEVDGWDDGWVICICDSAVSAGLHQSSPTAARSPPFKGGFSLAASRPGGQAPPGGSWLRSRLRGENNLAGFIIFMPATAPSPDYRVPINSSCRRRLFNQSLNPFSP